MEIRNLTGYLIAINKGMFVESVILCCVPASSAIEIFYHGREVKLGNYSFYDAVFSDAKKLEVDILGIHFNFDGHTELRNKSQDVSIGDDYSRYSPSFLGVDNDAPIEAVLSAGVEKDLPLNEEVKAVVVRFLTELYHYFYGRGFNLYYETKE